MKQNKQTQQNLNVHEKIAIIDYCKENPKLKHTRVAQIFSSKIAEDVNRRSIKNYLDNEFKLRQAYASNSNLHSILKFKEIDNKLKEWIDMVEYSGGFYNDSILQKKALYFYEEMKHNQDQNSNVSIFKASNGWLEKFKKRHNIQFRSCSGESFEKQNENYDEFVRIFRLKLDSYQPNNIFNCDETALFYKLAPSKTMYSKVRNGIEKYKDRITILLCCNMDGFEKLQLFIIGKSRKPRAFKNFNYSSFCRYSFNETSWMTSKEFNLWLMEIDLRMKREKRKILLLMNNFPNHKITYNANFIELLFLPKNSTSKLQPLDAGVIKSFKARYYHYQLSNIVNKITYEKKAETLFKELRLNDAIIYIAYAWQDISKEIIRNFWQHTGLTKEDSLNNPKIELIQIENYEKLIKEMNIIDTICQDEVLDLDLKFEYRIIDPIVALPEIQPEVVNEECENSDSENIVTYEEKLSVDVAISYFDKLKLYLAGLPKVLEKSIESLKLIESLLNSQKCCNRNKTLDLWLNK